ncbi:MAG: hypothetical protein KBD78_13155 [Oligoflexales bacterium]|nr:hypothetical protein [Oligoflexales bacterium]
MNINTILNKIENHHNRLSDLKAIWFPFVFLKPKPENPLSWNRIIVMSLSFGLYYVALRILKRLVLSEAIPTSQIISWGQEGFFGFLFWFSLVTRYFWNRRAGRLKNY